MTVLTESRMQSQVKQALGALSYLEVWMNRRLLQIAKRATYLTYLRHLLCLESKLYFGCIFNVTHGII